MLHYYNGRVIFSTVASHPDSSQTARENTIAIIVIQCSNGCKALIMMDDMDTKLPWYTGEYLKISF